MKRSTLIIAVLGLIVATALVIVGARSLLQSDTPSTDNAATTTASAAPTDTEVAARPDCAANTVAGVELECLGGDNGEENISGVHVVNVWAWWCQPCREELPHIEQYARDNPEVTVSLVHADATAAAGADMLNELGIELASYQDDSNQFAGTLGLPNVIPVTVVLKDEEMVTYFPAVFSSPEEIEQRVDEALAEAA